MTSYKALVGVLAAGSMFVSSTAAVAATSSTPTAVNPWAALTAMSGGAPTASMCSSAVAGAAAAAAQAPGGCVLPALDAPPPVAQVGAAPVAAVAPVAAAGFNPLLLALALVAAGVGAYLVTKGDDDGPIVGFPNSPA